MLSRVSSCGLSGVDGFIVSSNIEVLDICNVETKQGNLKVDGFAFSDHQPSVLEFKLL